MTLSELADAVEGLSGPDREMDAAIFRAVDAPLPDEFAGKKIALTFDEARHAFFMDVGSDMVVRYEPPAYTASLDAVLSLVDKWDEWSISTIYCIARAEVGINRDYQKSWPGRGEHAGCNPVLAFLSAALRARASEKGA